MVGFVRREMGGGGKGNYGVDVVCYSTCSIRIVSLVTDGWKNLEMQGEKIRKKMGMGEA